MRLVATLLLAACLGSALAQSTPFQASIPVPDQSAAARDQGLREALAVVIERVSGAGALAAAEPLLARAPQLVQAFGFERDPATGQLRLAATFDPRAVESALKAAGLPVFGVHAGAVEDAELTIAGIRGAADYARAVAAVRGAPGVRSVAVIGAAGERLHLRVRAEGGGGRLAGALAAGGALARDADGALSFTLVR